MTDCVFLNRSGVVESTPRKYQSLSPLSLSQFKFIRPAMVRPVKPEAERIRQAIGDECKSLGVQTLEQFLLHIKQNPNLGSIAHRVPGLKDYKNKDLTPIREALKGKFHFVIHE